MTVFEWFHSVMTLISMGLTSPALTVCVLVLMSWHVSYVEYCRTRSKDPSLMLIAGVYIGFFGSMVDNAWWGLAWSFDYLSHPYRDFFFHNGIYPNTFFRQGALIWAGILHVSAENLSRKTKGARDLATRNTRRIIVISAIVGLAYMALLFAMKTTVS